MINIALFLAALFFFLICVLMSVVDSMHFFQLNSYRFDTHLGWAKANASRYFPHAFTAVFLLIIACLPFNIRIKLALTILLYAFGCVVERPKKAKKPLVYTARVKRMLVTLFVLLFAALYFLKQPLSTNHESIALLVLALIYSASPALVPAVNLINKPMELYINHGYIRQAKAILAACDDLSIIGVTGSYGKTSVKHYLTAMLKTEYNVLMTPASYNTPMGVVKTVRGELRATDEIFVCEMGAKWVGDIKELCDIVHPRHGIITSIGPQHLESFGSMENIKKTKFELADALPEDGMLFLNMDDENIRSVNHPHRAVTYGVEHEADYTADGITVSGEGTQFTVHAPDGTSQVYKTRLLGKHNVINIVGCVAVCHSLYNIPLPRLKGAIRRLKVASHRLELVEKGSMTIIDDAYNSNPAGSKAALEVLGLFDGYRVLVTPGMVELGEQQEALNERFGEYAAEVCDYVVLVGQRQAVPIKRGLLSKGFDEKKILVADTVEKALSHVYGISSGGKKKIVLLENDLPDNY